MVWPLLDHHTVGICSRQRQSRSWAIEHHTHQLNALYMDLGAFCHACLFVNRQLVELQVTMHSIRHRQLGASWVSSSFHVYTILVILVEYALGPVRVPGASSAAEHFSAHRCS